MNKENLIENRYTKVFGDYDIRGIVGEDLNSSIVFNIARAYGEYLCPDYAGRFVIGHDARWSSPAFAEAVSLGLRESGHQVTHIGLSSTPIVYWYGAEGGFDGSIMISASHLPAEYNGLKLCRRDALPLSSEYGLSEIAAILQKPALPATRLSSELLRYNSPLPLYAHRIREWLKPVKNIKVAVDAGNGMGGVETDAVFSDVDCIELWRLDFKPDGRFPSRPSNPLEPQALDHLSQIVRKHALAFGLAFDGDADRAVVIDEKGGMVPPDALGGLIALHLLRKNVGATILHDLRTSRVLPELVNEAGGKSVRSRVGHAFIKRAMRDNHALFAMELSGHYYYSDLYYTDNGLRTLVELVNIVSAEDKPLSELIKPFQRYPTSGEINLRVADRKRVLTAMGNKYCDGHIDHLDGLSLDYPDWWFNVRSSNTESILRLNIGATNQLLLQEKIQMLLEEIDHINQSPSGE